MLVCKGLLEIGGGIILVLIIMSEDFPSTLWVA